MIFHNTTPKETSLQKSNVNNKKREQTRVKKETTDELMDEQRRTQRGHTEVMHACERDNSKSFFFETKRKMVVKKKSRK